MSLITTLPTITPAIPLSGTLSVTSRSTPDFFPDLESCGYWSSSLNYSIGNIVYLSSPNRYYIAQIANKNVHPFSNDKQQQQQQQQQNVWLSLPLYSNIDLPDLTFKGIWKVNQRYTFGQLVLNMQKSLLYIAKASNRSVSPDDNTSLDIWHKINLITIPSYDGYIDISKNKWKLEFKNTYSFSTKYTLGNIVINPIGTWICLQRFLLNTAPSLNGNNTNGSNWIYVSDYRGFTSTDLSWNPMQTYHAQTLVIYDGIIYRCLQQSRGRVPGTETTVFFWKLVFSINKWAKSPAGENNNDEDEDEDPDFPGEGVTGIQGTPGMTGVTGPRGPDGPPGFTGKQGTQGSTGIEGPKGKTGTIGSQGPIGPPGTTGFVGFAGIDGPRGITGIIGFIGVAGPQGATGIMGFTGVDGPQGATGITGIMGFTGIDGPRGSTGITGIMGFTGIDGPRGATGIMGFTGIDGPRGITGIMGFTGIDGPRGTTGMTGFTGFDGPQGATGITGFTGFGGPRGATGITGFTGFDGPQGATGITGFTGFDGPRGATGITGFTGFDGPRGTTGITGFTGFDGPQGATGITGFTGFTGPQGSTGITGFTGFDGSQGATGITGFTGFDGSQGATGITGFTGFDGPQGTTGITGFTGFDGPQGTTGITGFTGFDGPQGTTGITGFTGFTGPQGTTGITGFTGFTGPQGTTGITGFTGFTGPRGATGITGFTGINGPQGASGITGFTGFRGPSGAMGPTGEMGPNGLAGFTGPRGPDGLPGNTGITGANGATGLPGFAGPNGPDGMAKWLSQSPLVVEDGIISFTVNTFDIIGSNFTTNFFTEKLKGGLLVARDAGGYGNDVYCIIQDVISPTQLKSNIKFAISYTGSYKIYYGGFQSTNSGISISQPFLSPIKFGTTGLNTLISDNFILQERSTRTLPIKNIINSFTNIIEISSNYNDYKFVKEDIGSVVSFPSRNEHAMITDVSSDNLACIIDRHIKITFGYITIHGGGFTSNGISSNLGSTEGITVVRNNIYMGNRSRKKILSLYDDNDSPNDTSRDDFYGFGVDTNAGALRYQVPQNKQHIWYIEDTKVFAYDFEGFTGLTGSTFITTSKELMKLDSNGKLTIYGDSKCTGDKVLEGSMIIGKEIDDGTDAPSNLTLKKGNLSVAGTGTFTGDVTSQNLVARGGIEIGNGSIQEPYCYTSSRTFKVPIIDVYSTNACHFYSIQSDRINASIPVENTKMSIQLDIIVEGLFNAVYMYSASHQSLTGNSKRIIPIYTSESGVSPIEIIACTKMTGNQQHLHEIRLVRMSGHEELNAYARIKVFSQNIISFLETNDATEIINIHGDELKEEWEYGPSSQTTANSIAVRRTDGSCSFSGILFQAVDEQPPIQTILNYYQELTVNLTMKNINDNSYVDFYTQFVRIGKCVTMSVKHAQEDAIILSIGSISMYFTMWVNSTIPDTMALTTGKSTTFAIPITIYYPTTLLSTCRLKIIGNKMEIDYFVADSAVNIEIHPFTVTWIIV